MTKMFTIEEIEKTIDVMLEEGKKELNETIKDKMDSRFQISASDMEEIKSLMIGLQLAEQLKKELIQRLNKPEKKEVNIERRIVVS